MRVILKIILFILAIPAIPFLTIGINIISYLDKIDEI